MSNTKGQYHQNVEQLVYKILESYLAESLEWQCSEKDGRRGKVHRIRQVCVWFHGGKFTT